MITIINTAPACLPGHRPAAPQVEAVSYLGHFVRHRDMRSALYKQARLQKSTHLFFFTCLPPACCMVW